MATLAEMREALLARAEDAAAESSLRLGDKIKADGMDADAKMAVGLAAAVLAAKEEEERYGLAFDDAAGKFVATDRYLETIGRGAASLCPFCGNGPAELSGRARRNADERHPGCTEGPFYVSCPSCGASGPCAGTPLRAAEIWNMIKVLEHDQSQGVK